MVLKYVFLFASLAAFAHCLSCYQCGSASRGTSCESFNGTVQQIDCPEGQSKCYAVSVEFRFDAQTTIMYDRSCTSDSELCADVRAVYGSEKIRECQECSEDACNNAPL